MLQWQGIVAVCHYCVTYVSAAFWGEMVKNHLVDVEYRSNLNTDPRIQEVAFRWIFVGKKTLTWGSVVQCFQMFFGIAQEEGAHYPLTPPSQWASDPALWEREEAWVSG